MRISRTGDGLVGPATGGDCLGTEPKAVLFDRDDTLIVDEPYLADAKRVRPMPGAEQVLRRLREAGMPIGVVSNQSGVARGLITEQQLAEVNARVEELLGPFGTWQVCVHGEGDGCPCRKPKPGLVRQAAHALGVRPADCVVIGDIGSDLGAARAAGATGILVPTERTRAEEIRSAAHVARDLHEAVGLAMGERAW
jgi:HAD superfamily hydrolase (TIGR01662 family)